MAAWGRNAPIPASRQSLPPWSQTSSSVDVCATRKQASGRPGRTVVPSHRHVHEGGFGARRAGWDEVKYGVLAPSGSLPAWNSCPLPVTSHQLLRSSLAVLVLRISHSSLALEGRRQPRTETKKPSHGARPPRQHRPPRGGARLCRHRGRRHGPVPAPELGRQLLGPGPLHLHRGGGGHLHPPVAAVAAALLGHLHPLAGGHPRQHPLVGVVWLAGQSHRLLVRRRLRLEQRLAARRPVRQVQGRHCLCLPLGAALARVGPHWHLLGAQARAPRRPRRRRPPPPPLVPPLARLSKGSRPWTTSRKAAWPLT